MLKYIEERPWLYRGLRTFFQAFVSTLASQIVIENSLDFSKTMFFSILASSLAGGISAVMNMNKQADDVNE